MKYGKINILLIVVMFMIGNTSCSDFLDEQPQTNLTSDQVYTNLNVLEQVVEGLYTSFRGSKQGREGFTFTLLGLDESQQGIVQMGDASQSGFDYYNGMLSGTSSPVAAMWGKRWSTVNTASKCIFGLNSMAETETAETALERIRVLKAHASFMRALPMFEMAMYWGEIPVIEIVDLEDHNLVDTSRRPLSEVWTQIYNDFDYASKNLPEGKQTTSRATRGAAIAMLGKLHMYAQEESGFRNFSKAAEYFEEIKNAYQLHSSYGGLFDEFGGFEFNSSESIFEIDFTCNSQAPSHWQWDMGSRTLATLGESCYIAGYDVALPTQYAYRMKNDPEYSGVWEEGDLRREVSIRYDFTYRGQSFSTPSWGADELDPHIKKWEDRRLDKFSTPVQAKDATSGRSMYWSGKNYAYLRYADILLCYAECLNELNRTNEAIPIVNTVRKRAWGGNLPADMEWKNMGQDQFRIDILDERMRELCFEGWRRMDLIRTGKFVELIRERNPWAKEKNEIREFHMRWPVPEVEIKNNPYMTMEEDQNPGY